MNTNYIELYNNFIKLTTDKKLYKNLDKQDIFSDRLILFLVHFAFFLVAFKNKKNTSILQEIYDFIFRQLELSIREIGYGDQSINKKMKDYLNLFHSLLDKIHFWDDYTLKKKTKIFDDMIEKSSNNHQLVNYFDNFCLKLSKYNLNSYLKSVCNQ